ncbi:MAG: UDP-4-amino-4,6-dideoxy-N-acetyl-beta-L-altrosamine transaminase [Candidatus Lokiarchaeota archaeon]|nr:UDP-4-amino-4,6-dideoxy-N-acetyl-beta-L-altrosamine transaminase [Candidatus Lokiarchaeota archaeon]
MIPYGKQHIDDDDVAEVVQALKSDYLTTGPRIAEFERRFSEHVGARYATAVANGTAALHVACLAAGLKQGDELVTTPMTFVASSNCALYCHAKPVLADIKDNGLISPSSIKQVLTSRSKIILPVHYAGFPCELDEIKEMADENNCIVIEDACHALGATYKESRIGDCKHSDMAVFSFHPVKHMTTGEGGIITTNSKEMDERLKTMRSHGIVRDLDLLTRNDGPWYYEMQILGYNYRMTDLQAALGISQLRKLDNFVRRRQDIARKYDEAFTRIAAFDVLHAADGCTASYHLYPILLRPSLKQKRRAIFEAMRSDGLGVQVHYIPVHHHPYYKALGFKKGSFPAAEDFYEREISIPLFYDLSDDDVNQVIDKVSRAVRE